MGGIGGVEVGVLREPGFAIGVPESERSFVVDAGLPRGLYPSTVVMLCDGEPVQVRRSFLWGGSTTVGETEDSAARFTASSSARNTAAFARLCRARSGAMATTSPRTSS